MPDDMTPEQLEAMIGARCGKLTGLGHEMLLELQGLAKDCLRFAAEYPEARDFAVDVVPFALVAAAEITEAVTRMAEHVQRRAEADRGDHGPGGQDLVLGREPHSESQPPATTEPLPLADLKALMLEAKHAVLTVNEALGRRLAQPPQAPAEEEAWRTAVVQVASRPLVAICHALEPAHVAPTSAHMIFALVREMVTQGSEGLAYLRPFQTPPAVTDPASPAPGGGGPI